MSSRQPLPATKSPSAGSLRPLLAGAIALAMSGSLSLSTVAQSDDPPLLDGLGGRSDLRSDDFGLVELLRSLRTATWGWVEAEERGRAARRVAGKFHEAITGSRRVAPAQMHPNHPRRVWTAHGA